MLLKIKKDDVLVEITEIIELINPSRAEVTAQIQAGEEEQPPEPFKKSDLVFPSGENLPQCWLDSNYKSKKSK
ncbi:acetyltransferase [Waterburya agarophytonicola K14]|uniref:Acetyltransferase n=1 Tax=Waterburya agarophytonicola KI4 TaxID=2874699 RepID=A0A964BNN6_9CYAN|nr:acetyltransferase [Waterburya agarophytonicola]MCC0176439.1 acetyltransferase [Waterburya agarophytonicola KI4]